MAVSPSYVLRETGSSLRRNVVMTIAAIVTMAVSLFGVAVVLLMRQEVNKEAIEWQGGVQMAIFMQPAATQGEISAVARQLQSTPGIKSVRFVNHQGAYQEFKTMFGAEPELVSVVTPADLPTSFRVVPDNAAHISALGDQFKSDPGVSQVQYAQKEIDQILANASRSKIWISVAAVVILGVAVVLIVTTLQLAIFARRREVAVMKLVGATNWFIRLPFMIEGMIHGVVGAAIGGAIAYLIRNHLSALINNSLLVSRPMYATPMEAVVTGIVILIIGAGVGALGSAFAVRRFLSV